MKKEIELLAPGGDIDSIKAAVLAGANAVYCGLHKFNARNRAANISFDDLTGILCLAHKHNCKVFLTLNIIILDSEIPSLITLLNKLINTSIDGVIIQDLGLFYILLHFFKGLKIHSSTQLTTHNEGQIYFLSKLAATRVNLSRELNIGEIKALTEVAHKSGILSEVFVHGSFCISFSGICYMSSLNNGNSGNRGRCSQPCRDQYVTTASGKQFPLNMKDNSAFIDLKALADAGVDSLKIEGRIKKFHYVYTVVDAWRKQLNIFYRNNAVNANNSALYEVFNRDFTNGFLIDIISKDMFIDNPRDNSAIRLAELNSCLSDSNIELAKGEIYEKRTDIITSVENKIKQIKIGRTPITICVSGKCGTPLKLSVQTPSTAFEVVSETNLEHTETQPIDYDTIFKRFKAINDTEYYIEFLELDNLQPNVFIAFKELTSIKNQILYLLNGSKAFLNPIDVPRLKKQNNENIKPTLSILISSPTDLNLSKETTADIYFQLPASLRSTFGELVKMFISNTKLIPWFPSVLIGDDYNVAVEFMQQVKPKRIVTNNTGIAYFAFVNGIDWIAGPHLNIVNSFSLLCLKETFNCSGAFISNEISKIQIKGIVKPINFNLYYIVYQPIMVMISRQCLFHQVTGCYKNIVDNECITQCKKSTSITNLNNETYFIDKTEGNYHRIYNEHNFLNTEIVTDIPNLFSSFFVDISSVTTNTLTTLDKFSIVNLFENHINAKPDASANLHKYIFPSTNKQHINGL